MLHDQPPYYSYAGPLSDQPWGNRRSCPGLPEAWLVSDLAHSVCLNNLSGIERE